MVYRLFTPLWLYSTTWFYFTLVWLYLTTSLYHDSTYLALLHLTLVYSTIRHDGSTWPHSTHAGAEMEEEGCKDSRISLHDYCCSCSLELRIAYSRCGSEKVGCVQFVPDLSLLWGLACVFVWATCRGNTIYLHMLPFFHPTIIICSSEIRPGPASGARCALAVS